MKASCKKSSKAIDMATFCVILMVQSYWLTGRLCNNKSVSIMIENGTKSDLRRIPKYIQIKERLKSEIDSGVFKPGDRLPSRSEMILKYNLSGVTASKAMDELVNEGYIWRVQPAERAVFHPGSRPVTTAISTGRFRPFRISARRCSALSWKA